MLHHAKLTEPCRSDQEYLGEAFPDMLHRYHEALRPFVCYLAKSSFNPLDLAEWDDLFMEINFETTPKRCAFETSVAGLESVNPRVKGGLQWCRASLARWAIAA